MTVSLDTTDRIEVNVASRLHKPGVAGSSPAAASSDDSVLICHTPAATYHGWLDRVSASQLKSLDLSPVEFYSRYISGEASPYSSAALQYGSLLHLWAELGEDKFWTVAVQYPESVLTPTGQLGKSAKEFAASQPEGTVLVTPSDWRKLYDQTRQILLNKAARALLEEAVDREFNVRFDWNGTKCKCRADGATRSVWYDLKTTKEVNPRRTAFRAVDDFRYDIQAAFYREAAVQCGWADHPMQFIFTSTVSPYLCSVMWLPAEVMERGRNRCLRLMSELKQRREWNEWLPADYGEAQEMFCPEWMKKGE